MTVFFVALLVILSALAELYLAKLQQGAIRFRSEADVSLAEPGQVFSLHITVSNHSRFPVMFLRLRIYFDRDVTVVGKARKERSGEYRMNYIFFLLPYRKKEFTIPLKIEERGVYTLGKYYLENGDYLGLTGAVHSESLSNKVVVMPKRAEGLDAVQALGGFLGDISVRRFILEDPVMVVGFREYTGREPMKSIAWNQSLRSGKLQVSQYDHTVEANATVVLNLEGEDREVLEQCLRIARTVCEELEKKRIAYDFYTNGDVFSGGKLLNWLAKGVGPQHYRTIMLGLGASGCVSLSPFSDLVDRCTGYRRTGSGYVLITPTLGKRQEPGLKKLRALSDFDVCILTGGEVAV